MSERINVLVGISCFNGEYVSFYIPAKMDWDLNEGRILGTPKRFFDVEEAMAAERVCYDIARKLNSKNGYDETNALLEMAERKI